MDGKLFCSDFQALSEGGTPLLQRIPVNFDPGNHSRPCHSPTLWHPAPLLGSAGSSALVLGIGWGACLGTLLLIKVITQVNVLLLASSFGLSY